MNKLDPKELFERIANDVPKELHQNLFVTGSLAAAYHFQAKLQGQAINTKDADLVVHPAGNISSCKDMTERLLDCNWRRTDQCFPTKSKEPVGELRAIRLFPPESNLYFIEFLNIPGQDQTEAKRWIPMQLSDGWYGLPSFRFLGIASVNRVASHVGLEYASPSMMALANLLSHPEVGTSRIESGAMKGVLRSAKDLGRVIALAFLAGREETETWLEPWLNSARTCFPSQWKELFDILGSGLEELVNDDNALEEARQTTDVGILNGLDVSAEQLRAIGERLMFDVIFPLRERSKE